VVGKVRMAGHREAAQQRSRRQREREKERVREREREQKNMQLHAVQTREQICICGLLNY
jgi:hypothetical protein